MREASARYIISMIFLNNSVKFLPLRCSSRSFNFVSTILKIKNKNFLSCLIINVDVAVLNADLESRLICFENNVLRVMQIFSIFATFFRKTYIHIFTLTKFIFVAHVTFVHVSFVGISGSSAPVAFGG
jgi:hypothetical protein